MCRAAMLPGPVGVDRSCISILSYLAVLLVLPTTRSFGTATPSLQAGNPYLLSTDMLSWCCPGFFTSLLGPFIPELVLLL